MSASRTLAASATGTRRRVPASVIVSTSNSPAAGLSAVLRPAFNVPIKAFTNQTPQWFERLAN